MPMTPDLRRYFELFNEISIIAQLTRAIMESRLPSGMTQPHFGVLNHLVRVGDGITPRDLSRAFQVPKNSMTNTLAGLERQGLIELRPHPEDGRSRCIYLTKAGKEFREQAIENLAPEIARLAESIRSAEVDAVLPLLTRIRRVLDENRQTTRKVARAKS
jgi:DNA-binding MarR family transcriptional regulator